MKWPLTSRAKYEAVLKIAKKRRWDSEALARRNSLLIGELARERTLYAELKVNYDVLAEELKQAQERHLPDVIEEAVKARSYMPGIAAQNRELARQMLANGRGLEEIKDAILDGDIIEY